MSPPRSAFICQRFHQDIPPTPTKQRQRRRPAGAVPICRASTVAAAADRPPPLPPGVPRSRAPGKTEAIEMMQRRRRKSIGQSLFPPSTGGAVALSLSVCLSPAVVIFGPRRRLNFVLDAFILIAARRSLLARCQDFCRFRRSWTYTFELLITSVADHDIRFLIPDAHVNRCRPLSIFPLFSQ